jgi:hypothetical protein
LTMGGDDQAGRGRGFIDHDGDDNQNLYLGLLESSHQRVESGRISWVPKMAG